MHRNLQRKTIVHVVQHLHPGGLEVMALELARVQARTADVTIVSLEGDRASALAAWPRLAAHPGGLVFLGKRPGLDPVLPERLRRLFRLLRPDCVHTHHIGPLLYAGLAARLAGVACRIHTEHDAWHLQDARRRRVVRLALGAARPILVADAPFVAQAVAKALRIAPPQTILNGIDTARFTPGDKALARARLGLPADGAIIAIAARLETVKGVDVAISALAHVPGAVLAIAGAGGERARLEQQAAALGLTDRVRFLGLLNETADLYRAADAMCLPSRAEGLPLALLEAQSCNLPVVATDVGGVSFGVDPETGILVPPEDPAALAQALRNTLCDTGSSRNSRGFVQRTASLEAMATAYATLIAGTAK